MQESLELATVQIPPLSLLRMILDRQQGRALRAGPAHPRGVRRPNVDPLAFHRQLSATHCLGRNQTQKLLIQLDIPHGLDPR